MQAIMLYCGNINCAFLAAIIRFLCCGKNTRNIPSSKKLYKSVAFFFHCGLELAHQAQLFRLYSGKTTKQQCQLFESCVMVVRNKRRT